MVEWKVDLRDGRPKLMEINPRFWGSLELAVRSGVNFPSLYADADRGCIMDETRHLSHRRAVQMADPRRYSSLADG